MSAINDAKDGVAIVVEIIKTAGDNPNAREAAGNLGKTALTITKTINNVLLPLAAVNYAIEKAKSYFEEKFSDELAEKTKEIPEENVVQPRGSVVGPALQALAFTHEEHDLKEMYLNLLASSMDGRVASGAHPAFVEIIKQMTAQEAQSLKNFLQAKSIPLAEVRLQRQNISGYKTLMSHLANYVDHESGEPVEEKTIPAMIDNLARLGLIDVSYHAYLNNEGAYSWVEKRPEYLSLKKEYEIKNMTVSFERGILKATNLGMQFGKVVGLAP